MAASPTQRRVVKSEAEWRSVLTPERYRVTRQAEPYWSDHRAGLYRCVACAPAPAHTSGTLSMMVRTTDGIAPLHERHGLEA
jgi:peptide-methionine (R)-S-oxide reductase